DVLLRMVDTIRDLLGRIESTGAESGVEVDAVVAVIQAALDGTDLGGTDAAEPAAEAAAADSAPAEAVSADAEPDVSPVVVVAAPTPAPPPAPAAAPALALPAPAPADVPEASVSRGTSVSSIRVDVDLLDALMRQVGELVLVRNQIAQLAGSDAEP